MPPAALAGAGAGGSPPGGHAVTHVCGKCHVTQAELFEASKPVTVQNFIQYVTSGRERMDWMPLDQVRVTQPYDPARDFCEGIDPHGRAVALCLPAGPTGAAGPGVLSAEEVSARTQPRVNGGA